MYVYNRGNIAKILPVLPVDNSKNTLGAKIVLLGDHSTVGRQLQRISIIYQHFITSSRELHRL